MAQRSASATESPQATPPVLTLDEKVRLLTGATSWETHPLEGAGLRAIRFSDGPVGVRVASGDGVDWSLLLPAPSAIGATWDPDAARRAGRLIAAEARRKGVDVVLAPVVNLQRTPVAGRHFEYFSEDPLLTGSLAAAFVAAVQDLGVGVCLKHFVANDSETDRTSYLASLDEATLREVYLPPFEHVIRRARPWVVMAAYNRVSAGGLEAPATEHRYLLRDVLKGEWGFDGVVVSDWLAATSTEETALGGLDLVMPGPGGPWESRLVEAVESGAVPVEVVDEKVERLLRLADRVGARDGAVAPAPREPLPDEDEARADLVRLAAQATVVLRNDADGAARCLPLDPAALTSVALIGAQALEPFAQGGGSGVVTPRRVVSPVDGLAAALPPGVDLRVHAGVPVTRFAQPLAASRTLDPETGTRGARVELLDATGAVVASRHADEWTGRFDVDEYPDVETVRVRSSIRLTEPGRHRIGVGAVGVRRVVVDGVVVDQGGPHVGSEVILDSSVNEPPDAPLDVDVLRPRTLALAADLQVIDGQGYGRFARAALRHELPGPSAAERIEEAAALAAAADVAVVVVGTTIEIESEGRDRSTLALPGSQDALVRRVAAANPRTVVVVNAGAPVLLPWLDDPAPDGPAAVLWWWLPGQEAGHALAAVLLGELEPAGRLPWTLPAREEDVPVATARPVRGVVRYGEGVDIGYRSWQRLHRRPARPFGFGLGWGTWRYGGIDVAEDAAGGDLVVAVDVTNVGSRTATEVVQVYASAADEPAPVRRLAGSATVEARPGGCATARVRVPRRALERWVAGTGWRLAGEVFRLEAGRDCADVRVGAEVRPRPAAPAGDARHRSSAVSAAPHITADVDRERTP